MSLSRRHFIAGHWVGGEGEPFHSTDPATGEHVWEGQSATETDIRRAVSAANEAASAWADRTVDERAALLKNYADQLKQMRPALAELISRETGKPDWEALAEVDAMIAKVAISIDVARQRRSPVEIEQAGGKTATRYRPIGVMAVYGPFNMPGHLPNGHIVPALLAGNSVVFKPSELTPGVGEKLVEALHAAAIPNGVINLVHGGREVGADLARQAGIDGILFTGSVAAGLALSRASLEFPGRMLALEMGGNNPLVVWDAADLDAAVYLTIQSAYISAGQRCSCARRLIIPTSAAGQNFLDHLVSRIKSIAVGAHTLRPEPFMGPVISDSAADRILESQASLISAGAKPLVEMRSLGQRRAFLTPGLIDTTPIDHRPDAEVFGPLLQVARVESFEQAVAEANRTHFGLAAGLLSDDADRWNYFKRKIRAGVVNWNRQTTGASSQLPFGGIGLSGNHRPSGSWAADYCSDPVAVMESPRLALPTQRVPGVGI